MASVPAAAPNRPGDFAYNRRSSHDSTTMTAFLRRHRQAAAARGRLMLWCGALVLLLFALAGHDHDNEVKAQDCVACSVQAQSLAAPPVPGAAPVRPPLLLAWAAPPYPAIAALPGHTHYLLPQPHAPPAANTFA